MLIDARRLAADRVMAGVCIIGTGMGGASAAKKLVATGQDVLFVEAGNDSREAATVTVQHESVGRDFGLPLTRVFGVGGSTNAWHGVCAPFDPIDFQVRDWIADSGWPISAGELAGYYLEAFDWLGADPASVDATDIWPRSAPEPAGAGTPGLTAKRFWSIHPAPSMKDVVLGWARAGRARCLTHATALQLRADGDGRVLSLVAGCGDRTIEIEAGIFVVAAGALETPRLLLNSHRANAQGFAAASTGRYLMDHPVGYFSQALFGQRTNSPFSRMVSRQLGCSVGIGLDPEIQKRFGLPNHYAFIRPGVGPARVPNDLLMTLASVRGAADLSPRRLLSILRSKYVLARIVRERLGISLATRYGDIYVMAEQVPNPSSRVTLSPEKRDRFGYPIARVDWRLTDDEWKCFPAFQSVLAERLNAETEVESVRIDAAKDWPRVLSSAAHHLGTARMAASPEHGVVDANLQVFGAQNLFVCDGSVFPTSGGTNPTLTISALALRLGDYLARMSGARVSRTPAAFAAYTNPL